MKIVVANSVGVDANGYRMVHVPSRWSLGIKNFTNCGYYPWQLAYTSALLKRETDHQIKFLDGVLKGWDFETYFSRLKEIRPDWLTMESSSRTIDEDLRLASAAKKAFGTRLIFTGQHPMAQPEEVLKTADYVCMGEYEYSVLELIQGKKPESIAGVYPDGNRELLDVNSLPYPEDEDIKRIDYHEPNCRYRQIQMYASRGCPRRCNFCAAATLYYDELNWRPRNVDDVVNEIRLLKEKYPEMEGVFFDEEVHNIKKSFNINLARAIRKADLNHLKFEALCEYVSLDEEALTEMRKAGYYKIRFGIETASDVIADKMTLGKKHALGKLRSILKFGKGLGFVFYATFSLGGLGSNEEEDQKTVDMIYELTRQGLLDEVQVSINTPQPGTDFYNTCVENSYLKSNVTWQDFDGNGHVVVDYPNYPAEDIQKMFNKALDAFDRGKSRANASRFLVTAKASAAILPDNSRVLLLRSARQWMIHLILKTLNHLPLATIDLLGQDAVMDDFHGNPLVNHLFTYGQGFFSADTFPPQLAHQLRTNDYDVILIPLANNHLDGYQNVLEVAELFHPKQILGIYPEGDFKELTPVLTEK
jgi:anaerobic magnesium-protoporphyrin IX monomethyl ester cyclase